MTAALIVAAVLAAGPAPSSAPAPRLAAPGFRCVNLEEKTCEFFTDFFAQQLATSGRMRVTTQSEISSLLGFERQKQLLGCSDEASTCLAEMAGALGVDGLVVGNVARFGTEFALNVKVLGASDGQTKASEAGRVKSEAAVLDWFTDAASRIGRTLNANRKAAARNPTLAEAANPTVAEPAPGPRLSPFLPLGAGAALAIGGGISYALAAKRLDELEAGQYAGQTRAELLTLGGQGRTMEIAGYSMMAVGVVGLGLGALLLAQPPDGRTPTLAVAPVHQGGAVTFSGVLP